MSLDMPIVESASQASTAEDLATILFIVFLFWVFSGSSSKRRRRRGGVTINPPPTTPRPNVKPKGQGKRNA